MKNFFKILVIIGLVSVNTACDWLKLLGWNPTYYDKEWVVEKVMHSSGTKIVHIYIQPQNVLYGFNFNGYEKLNSSFDFASICSINNSDIIVTRESKSYLNYIIFEIDKFLDPAIHKTMQLRLSRNLGLWQNI